MSIKETYKQLRDLLTHITIDLEKSENGNKAASQRVRTGTVKLEKMAKLFRKESIATEKKTRGQRKPAKAKVPVGAGVSASKAKGAKKSSAAVKARPKAAQARATAKLPSR